MTTLQAYVTKSNVTSIKGEARRRSTTTATRRSRWRIHDANMEPDGSTGWRTGSGEQAVVHAGSQGATRRFDSVRCSCGASPFASTHFQKSQRSNTRDLNTAFRYTKKNVQDMKENTHDTHLLQLHGRGRPQTRGRGSKRAWSSDVRC